MIDYIRTLEVTSTFGGNLADDVINQIDVCIAKVNACGSDFSEIVQNDKPKADALFLEAKKLEMLFVKKTCKPPGEVILFCFI